MAVALLLLELLLLYKSKTCISEKQTTEKQTVQKKFNVIFT